MMKFFVVMFAALLLATFDESIMAEAIIRMDNVPDSMYTELNGPHAPTWTRSIVQLNNMHSSCPNGAASCRMRNGRKTPFKVDCHATLISRKMAITSRHCFCHKGDDIAYNSGFTAVVGKAYRAKVKRTFVNPKCEFDCKRRGSHNDCDYAIVEFTKKVPKAFKPIEIWNAQRHGDEMHNTLLMAGFGSTGVAGKMSTRQCASTRQDGKLRAAAFKVEGLGRNGNEWGQNKYGVLRYSMGKKGQDSRLPQGLAALDDHGIPAFIMHKGKPKLVGVHGSRVRNFRNLENPCAMGANDEFTRLTSRKTHDWIRKVVAGKTERKMFFPLLHSHKRYTDMLPLQYPGSHAFPYKHDYGHRRRRSSSKRTEVPGFNKCRAAMPHLFPALQRKINLEVCGGLAPSKWPLEFFDPKFPEKIRPIMQMKRAAYRFDVRSKRFKLLKRNPFNKRSPYTRKAAFALVEHEHYEMMREVRNHFKNLVLKAGKLKVSHTKRLAAADAYRVLVPMEKRVKELQVKVHLKKYKWKTAKLSKKKAAKKKAASKWPRYKWRHQNNRHLARMKIPSLASEVKAGRKHSRLRVPHYNNIKKWWTTQHRSRYPRPHRNHKLHTTSIPGKRFSVWKIKAWKKHLHILRKWKNHYVRKTARAQKIQKKACKRKGSKPCKVVTKQVAKLSSKVASYSKLMKPYSHAVTRNTQKLWTPTSVVRAAHRYKKKMDKKKLHATKKVVKATAKAAASRRRSWMHFNPFKKSQLSKKNWLKAKHYKKGKSKGKRMSGTFGSEAKAAFGGGRIHVQKAGELSKQSKRTRCAYYAKQARALKKAQHVRVLKSSRKGKMLHSIRLPVDMHVKMEAANLYLKKHCHHHHEEVEDEEDAFDAVEDGDFAVGN